MRKIGIILFFLCATFGILAKEYSVKIEYPDTVDALSKNREVVIEPMAFEIIKGSIAQTELGVPHKVVTAKEVSIQENDIILKWSVSARSVNLGDTVHCYCDLYTKVNIITIDNTPEITLNDCFVEKDSLPSTKTFETVNYNGEKYWHVRLDGYRLTPLRAGHFKIGGDTYFCQAEVADPDPIEALIQGRSALHEIFYEGVSESVEFEVMGKEQSQTLTTKNNNQKRMTYLLCDISKSMEICDFYPDRKSVAKYFVGSWLQESKDCGLITFSSVIESIQKRNCVIDTISFPQSPKDGGTVIGDAILIASAIGEDVGDIILVTDGINNGGHFTMRTAIDILTQHNARLSLVYLNSGKDSVDYIVNDSIVSVKNDCFTPKQLKEISDLVKSTGGLFAKVTSEEELKEVIPKLQSIVSTPIKRKKIKNKFDVEQVKRVLQRLADELSNV